MKQLRTVLFAHGYSLTTPRTQVFETLRHGGPLTMADLIDSSGGNVNRASIYRTIALFEELGIVKRIQMGWKYRIELGDDFQPHHHHLFCISCQTATDIPENKTLESAILNLALAQNFQAQDHQLEIRGLCSSCRSSKRYTT